MDLEVLRVSAREMRAALDARASAEAEARQKASEAAQALEAARAEAEPQLAAAQRLPSIVKSIEEAIKDGNCQILIDIENVVYLGRFAQVLERLLGEPFKVTYQPSERVGGNQYGAYDRPPSVWVKW